MIAHWEILSSSETMQVFVTKNHTLFEAMINKHHNMKFTHWGQP